jgi:hypothetical protein
VAGLGQALGIDGMSSDETDQEASRGVVKTVRRVRKAWLAPEIADIWRTIETYHDVRTTGKHKRGNKAYLRTFMTNKDSFNRVKVHLPQNYYNRTWWIGLIPNDQAMVGPQDDRPLPNVSRYGFKYR